MEQILSILYGHAMENRAQYYLTHSDYREFRIALQSEVELEEQLKQLLQGESLRLFNQFKNKCDKEQYYSNVSAFRKGLAMGLKLGTFPFSEH